MKQRSLMRDRVPKQPFGACVRSSYIKQSYKPRPCSYGSKKAIREAFKKFYKKQRWKDREIGIEINRLFAEFFAERLYLKQSNKPADEETIKYMGQLAEQIKNLKEAGRFRYEFPSFSSFYRFVRQEGVTLEEIREE